MLRKLKWQISGESLAARYNWCQGPIPGRGPEVEKHWYKGLLKLYFVYYNKIRSLTDFNVRNFCRVRKSIIINPRFNDLLIGNTAPSLRSVSFFILVYYMHEPEEEYEEIIGQLASHFDTWWKSRLKKWKKK